jgi:T-complex protein 1 subunit theta
MYAKAAESTKFGIDVRDGKVKDVVEAAVLDSLETKSWALKLAFDVVLTILKVDQIIMSKPAGGPKMDQAARRPDGYDE